jgi:hypothetical protein
MGFTMSTTLLENELESLALEACKRAKANLRNGEERLRSAIEAGRLLRKIDRSPGIRTSSSSLTRLQVVIKEAGVSRQAAHVWQKAAEIAEPVVADYVAQARDVDEDISVAGLLRFAKSPNAKPNEKDVDDGDDKCVTCPKCGTLVGVAA